MTDLELAYLAGFIDGEGCISCVVRYNSVYPKVLVTNTNKLNLDWACAEFGGNVYTRTSTKKEHKDVHTWNLASKEGVTRFLEAVIPHLKMKRQQAMLILKLCSLPLLKDSSTAEKILSFKLFELVQDLNKTGQSEDPIQ